MSEPSVTLHLGDCLDVLRTLESGSVNAVVTDPPYGVGYANWDGDMPSQEFLDECLRVSKGPVLWFGASVKLLAFSMYSPPPERILAWAPAFSLGKSTKDGAFYRWHPILVWRPGLRVGKLGSDVLRHNCEGRHWWNHPATKPELLLIDLVKWTIPEGGIGLDPYMGSGTTGVACVRAGLNFIGCEIDPGYHEIASRRIEAERNRMPLLTGSL